MNDGRPGYPFANTALARYVDRRIDKLRGVRTVREIAADAGFNKPNVVSMIRSGQTQLAFDKVPGMARALDADPVHILRLALEDRWPELKATIAEVFDGRRMATRNEAEILLYPWRSATRDTDPMPSPKVVAELKAILVELAKRAVL